MDEIEKGTKDFEGFVFRDKEGKRIKLKRTDYIRLHHMLDTLSFKNLIPKILDGEELEIVSYFPHVKELIDKFIEKFNKYVDNAVVEIQKFKGLDRKTIALRVFGGEIDNNYLRSLIMKFYDADYTKNAIIQHLKELGLKNPKKLMEILELSE
jgi:TusA-related sulfurtransferase